MGLDRTHITDKNGFNRGLKNRIAKTYQNTFGAAIGFFFKPFTTFTSATGVAKYQTSVYASGIGLAHVSGQFTGADSSGLNPFGRFTLNEGIVSGPSRTNDLDASIDPGFVRAYGFKTPANYVGWGYDQFGYPAPNDNRSWNVSGTFSTTGPRIVFANSGGGSTPRGSEVPQTIWNAGPLDLRWDPNRKVFTGHSSVYAGIVTQSYSSGVVITDFNTPLIPDAVTYDIQFYDGVANRAMLTGIRPVSPRPPSGAIKVYPLQTGSFAFIVHANNSGIPGYAAWVFEQFGTTQCSGISSDTSEESLESMGLLSLSSLAGNPLTYKYGGTGFTTYSSGSILIGSGGALIKRVLTAGTGIEITNDGTNLTVKFSTGVAFLSAGVNNNITELQGLTTPLSISQGGIGSATKNFIDLSSAQNVSGIKNFNSPLRISSGVYTGPSLAFVNDVNTGMYLLSNRRGLGLTASGNKVLDLDCYGSQIYSHLIIEPMNWDSSIDGSGGYAPLMVKSYSDFNNTNPLQLWFDRSQGIIGSIEYFGRFNIPAITISNNYNFTPNPLSTGNLFNIDRVSGFTGNTIQASGLNDGVYFSVNSSGTQLTLGPSGQTTIFVSNSGNRTVNFASGYTGTVGVGHPTTTGIRNLEFQNGLFVGYTDI